MLTLEGLKSSLVTEWLQRDAFSLPPHDALAEILPHYQSHPSRAKAESQGTAEQDQETPADQAKSTEDNKPNINHTYRIHHPHRRPPLQDFEDDSHMTRITDLQTKEVENYRLAMGKMADDIITLRTQVLKLEADNSQLRSDLSLHQDLGRDLLNDTDVDVMTKAEVADRIAHLKFKLASETSKTTSQRDRIHQLQNELIKKNDSQKELLKLQRVHQQEQEHLQHQQANMAALEVTVKQQEKVIEKMEKALGSELRQKKRHSGDKRHMMKTQRDMESALAAENARLRKELERSQQLPAPVIIQLPAQEKLILLHKLEKAEARVQTLEAQMEKNAKSWGREKQELMTKLSEHRRGFVRTSTAILQNVPSGS
ncbi:coiled-coil domain-containing protein 33 [Parambassis ranga]|uniref:Coiled-coil domain-containing protein 33 n=1 Tax=Parambassis ranga TaxID=210632 RepID=A0A6P7KD49_9TELE|nr:coiled-coil domain-containing protein 33 [Parambassis ranga]